MFTWKSWLGFVVTLIVAAVDVPRAFAGGPLFPGEQYSFGLSPGAVAIGDLNGDGTNDLAVTHDDTPHVAVLLNPGDGTMPKPVRCATEDNAWGVALADFDGDIWPDLAVALPWGDAVQVFPSRGDGTFGEPLHYATYPPPWGVAAGDLNRDGWPDLALATRGTWRLVQVRIGRINLRFG